MGTFYAGRQHKKETYIGQELNEIGLGEHNERKEDVTQIF